MQHTTLAAGDWPARTDAFNRVYEGYVMPVQMSEDHLRQHFLPNAVALDQSPLWLDDKGAVIGLAALGIRGDRGWLGAFGVATPYRGRGFGHRLIAAVIDRAQTAGLAHIQLEVISHNHVAIKTYKRAGLTVTRDLRVLHRAAIEAPRTIGPPAVHPIDPSIVIDQLMARRDGAPCWQREPASLAHLPELAALTVDHPDPLQGYVLVRSTAQGVRIADLGARNAHAATILAAAINHHFPDYPLHVLNEPANSTVADALDQAGWRETVCQHEMHLDLR